MKETGIIMSGDHPGKIEDGTKTMTRRTYGLEKINENPDRYSAPDVYKGVTGKWFAWFHDKESSNPMIVNCPYGGVGDLLWVREAHAVRTDGVNQVLYKAQYTKIVDLLDLDNFRKERGYPPPNISWKPSIHMFRKDSRIQMPISSLRPERLQDISNEDAKAEGIYSNSIYGDFAFHWSSKDSGYETARTAFKVLWDSLNAKRGYGWEFNPWVWRIGWPKHSPKKD